LAPRASSSFTDGASPFRAAAISAVSPSGVAVCASAPASSSLSRMAADPIVAAICNGAMP
jgi:hypothetical protein